MIQFFDPKLKGKFDQTCPDYGPDQDTLWEDLYYH